MKPKLGELFKAVYNYMRYVIIIYMYIHIYVCVFTHTYTL